MVNRLIFIGYMASGKSTAAQALSHHSGLPAHDVDEAIVQRFGRSIPEIFATDGERAFRAMERQVIGEMLADPLVRIVACGGGLPCDASNQRILKAGGRIVWLDPPFEVIYERLAYNQNRPLAWRGEQLLNADELRPHWAERRTCYESLHAECIQQLDDACISRWGDWLLAT